MATLQKIRNRAGLLILVIGIALLAFLIGDGLRSSSSIMQGDRQVVLKLNGEKIGYQQYAERLSELTERYEAQGNHLSDEDRMYMNNQLAQEFIQTRAIEEIAESAGIKVTPKESLALITGDGVQQSFSAMQFLQQMGVNPADKNAVNTFISQLDPKQIKQMPEEVQSSYLKMYNYWQNLLTGMTNERTMQKFNAIMARAYVLNKVDKSFIENGASRTVALVRTPSTILEDEKSTATDAEVEEYYKKHIRLFKLQSPYTKVDYISMQVRPAHNDLKLAYEDMLKAKAKLAESSEEETVVRNYNNGFAADVYLTEDEVSSMNLADPLMTFLKESEVGSVNTPALEDDHYELIKLIDRKVAPASVTAQIVVLDTINATKIDSLIGAINSGKTTFEAVVAEYSVDKQTKAEEGFLSVQNPRTGQTDRNITRRIAKGSGLDVLFEKNPHQAFAFGEGKSKVIMQVASLGEAGTLYKFAYAQVPSTFSDETFREAHTKMNTILSMGDDFAKMTEEAEKQGLQVMKDISVGASTASLPSVPSSREVVSWALRGKKGDINEKIFRCGDDYLVIARIGETITAETQPLDDLKENIRNIVTAEKRGNMLATKLASKSLSSLQAYATEMKSVVDTVSNVSPMPTGSMPAEFNGMAFNTKLNTLSKPFRAQSEVMVVMPINEVKATATPERKAQTEQIRNGVGQALGNRAFQYFIREMKIKDNRGNFY